MTGDGDRPAVGGSPSGLDAGSGAALGPEQARALFARALDDELSAEERAALEEALSHHPELEAELTALRHVVQAAGKLSDATPSVDLLASVQGKLRSRSGGRFYRDRFAQRRGRGALLPWMVAASILVVLVTLVWFGFEAGVLHR